MHCWGFLLASPTRMQYIFITKRQRHLHKWALRWLWFKRITMWIMKRFMKWFMMWSRSYFHLTRLHLQVTRNRSNYLNILYLLFFLNLFNLSFKFVTKYFRKINITVQFFFTLTLLLVNIVIINMHIFVNALDFYVLRIFKLSI